MGTFKLACHLIQFRGEQHEHPEKVLAEVAEAGWDGVEGLRIEHADDLVDKANLAKSHGLHLVNVGGPTPRDRIRYNIALGNEAAEVPSLRRAAWGGDEPSDADIETAARTLDDLLAYCAAHHVKGFHHAHMRTLIETVEDAEKLMVAAPDLWLLYDTGHLLASGSDPMRVFDSAVLRDRIGHVHLKDVHADDPATWNHRTGQFNAEARFAELGAGNLGFDAKATLEKLEAIGYDGWISVELDRPYPPKSAAEAAKSNREYLRSMGY